MIGKSFLRCLLLALACASAGVALAQDYPSKPIFITHGLSAGGQVDVSVRLLADALSRKLNVPVVVQAKPGAAQAIAISALVKAAPDGYSLGHFYQGALSTVPLLQKVSYTPDDLEPIIGWQMSPQVLAVRADSPYNNLKDLVAAAKAHPDTPFAFGHNGKGSVTFMAPTVFAKDAGIRLEGVQFKGESETILALLGGHIPLGSLTQVAAAPLLASGKIKVLVTFAQERSPDLPGVPTFEDQGFHVPLQVPVGMLFAPRNTPAPIVKKIHDAVREIIQDEQMKKEFANINQVLYYMDAKSIRNLIDSERKAYYPILKSAGLTQ
jgi:tripartite-type tricarboxylate transporter receptor subunit TctC